MHEAHQLRSLVGRNKQLARIGRDPDEFDAFYREHIEAVQRFVARRVSDR